MASGGPALNVNLTTRDRTDYANLMRDLNAADQAGDQDKIREVSRNLSAHIGSLVQQQKPVDQLFTHQDRLLIGKLENRDGHRDFFRSPEMAPLRQFAEHGSSKSDRMDRNTDPNRSVQGTIEDTNAKLGPTSTERAQGTQEASPSEKMRNGIEGAIVNSDVKQVQRLLEPFAQIERDLGRGEVADQFEQTLKTHQDNPEKLKQAIGETQLYKDFAGMMGYAEDRSETRSSGFRGALEDAAKKEGKKYTEKRDELRAGLMNHWARVTINETMSAEIPGGLKGPGLFGTLTAGSLLSSTRGRIPDDVKKRLEDLQKENPQLAGTIRETLWDKNRFEMSFDQNIRDMQSVVHSGLPIESVVMIFSMLYMDTNEKRLQAKMSEMAAAEAIEKENQGREHRSGVTRENDAMLREWINERGAVDGSKEAAKVEVPNIVPEKQDPLKGRDGAQDKNPNHVRSWRRTLERKSDEGKLLDGLAVAVNNSVGRAGLELDVVPPQEDPNYKDVLVLLAGPDATTKLSSEGQAAVDLLADDLGVSPDQARLMIRDRLRESMDRGNPKLEAAAREATLHDTTYLQDPNFTAYTPEQKTAIMAHEAERAKLFTNLKNDPTALMETHDGGNPEERFATLLRSHADVAAGKQSEPMDPEKLEREVAGLRSMGPEGKDLADKIVASNEAKIEYQNYTKESAARIQSLVEQHPDIPRGQIYKELAEVSATKAAMEVEAKSLEHDATKGLEAMQTREKLDPTKFGLSGKTAENLATELAALQKRFEQVFNALMNIMTTLQGMGDAIVRKIS